MSDTEKIQRIENTVDALNRHLIALYQIVDDLADELIEKEPSFDSIGRRVKNEIVVLKTLKTLRK